MRRVFRSISQSFGRAYGSFADRTAVWALLGEKLTYRLVATRDLVVGEKVLTCNGPEFKRDYATSCTCVAR